MRHLAAQRVALEGKSISEPVYFILLCLADKPLHGYGLIKEIAALSAGRLELTTGTLYGAIKRLLEDGWIKRFAQEDTSREKQAYALTSLGRRHLNAEFQRLKQLTSVTSRILQEI